MTWGFLASTLGQILWDILVLNYLKIGCTCWHSIYCISMYNRGSYPIKKWYRVKVRDVLRQRFLIDLDIENLLLGDVTLREIQRENALQKIIITSSIQRWWRRMLVEHVREWRFPLKKCSPEKTIGFKNVTKNKMLFI